MPKEFINPSALSAPTGYTHVVRASGSRTIYIAGQIAFDRDGNLVGKGDLRLQAGQVFENLKAALAAVGATFDDVVKMTTYVVNYKPEYRPLLREVRSQYLNSEHPPANTLVGVQSLALSDLLIEVEAIAVVD